MFVWVTRIITVQPSSHIPTLKSQAVDGWEIFHSIVYSVFQRSCLRTSFESAYRTTSKRKLVTTASMFNLTIMRV